jgi:hypothetical protein
MALTLFLVCRRPRLSRRRAWKDGRIMGTADSAAKGYHAGWDTTPAATRSQKGCSERNKAQQYSIRPSGKGHGCLETESPWYLVYLTCRVDTMPAGIPCRLGYVTGYHTARDTMLAGMPLPWIRKIAAAHEHFGRHATRPRQHLQPTCNPQAETCGPPQAEHNMRRGDAHARWCSVRGTTC